MFTTLFGKLMVWSSGWSLPLLEKYEQNGGAWNECVLKFWIYADE